MNPVLQQYLVLGTAGIEEQMKAHLSDPNLGVIAGMHFEVHSDYVSAVAIDARDGQMMARDSDIAVEAAMGNLGMTPENAGGDHGKRLRVYGNKYPKGYVIYWLGYIEDSDLAREIHNKWLEATTKDKLRMIVNIAREHDGKPYEIVDLLYEKYKDSIDPWEDSLTYEQQTPYIQ